MHDLLTDELIGVRTPQGPRQVSLPTLLAGLAEGRVDGYTGLRAHQADPWHVFLVQVAASIQARHPTVSLPTDATYWHDGLLDLADGQATAWCLVVEDVTKPAFFQHPWQSLEADAEAYGAEIKRGTLAFAPKASSPDELDMLITSRNHDLKRSRIGAHETTAWIYALVTSQTMSPYSGKKTYGVARMKSGSGSRPIVACIPDRHPSLRFTHEVNMLGMMRSSVVAAYGYIDRSAVLTWLTPWKRDGHQVMLNQLEPWFIEAARPVRILPLANGALVTLRASTESRQIGPTKPHEGDVGDPWIPMDVRNSRIEQAALTISASGFTPNLLTNLIFEQGFKLTEVQKPQRSQTPGWFVASVIVGGNCTTDGFHRIELPIPAKARPVLLSPERRDSLAHFAKALLTDAATVMTALRTALTLFSEGGPDSPDFDRVAVKRWVDRTRVQFARRWEATYFPTLWRAADEDRDRIQKDWQSTLIQQAWDLLADAHTRLPVSSNRRYRAITASNGAFVGILRKKQMAFAPQAAPTLDTQEETTA